MGESESRVMRLFKYLGLERIAWALRRLHCPVSKDALVLEVGSGGNPYARANVLLDAYVETRERHWAPLVSDRPTVLGFVENLPFKDKAFDFVIASHVFEHSSNPEKFLHELQRVAKAGYIEVPDAFMERINPYLDHRLEVTVRQGKLVILKKNKPIVDETLVELYSDRAKVYIAGNLIPSHPFTFHVRYYWDNDINFIVLNPEEDAAWQEATGLKEPPQHSFLDRKSMRQRAIDIMRLCLSQRRRNRQIDLLSLLRCPNCFSVELDRGDSCLQCKHCNMSFLNTNCIPVMHTDGK